MNYADPPLFSVSLLQESLPNSPLGSPPNTPQSPQQSQQSQQPLNTSLATFESSKHVSLLSSFCDDESLPMDEKIYDAQDVIMGDLDELNGPDDEIRRRLESPDEVGEGAASIKSTPTAQHQKYLPEDEPPSLVRRSKQKQTRAPSTVSNLIKPSTISADRRAKITSDLGHHQYHGQSSKDEMQQHMNFMALKNDILLRNQQVSPSPMELKTPEKSLLSPPKVLLKKTLWDPNVEMENEGLLPPLSASRNKKKNTVATTHPEDAGPPSAFQQYARRRRPSSSYDSAKNIMLDEFDSIIAQQDDDQNHDYPEGHFEGHPGDEAAFPSNENVPPTPPPAQIFMPCIDSDIPDDERGDMMSSEPPLSIKRRSFEASSQRQSSSAKEKWRPRQLTPKQDFQTSEKSNPWLQEEFQRRSYIKKGISDVILAQNSVMSQTEIVGNVNFTKELTTALEALPPGANESIMQSSLDEEVAAITEEDNGSIAVAVQNQPTEVGNNDSSTRRPAPRRLNYDTDEKVTLARGRKNPHSRNPELFMFTKEEEMIQERNIKVPEEIQRSISTSQASLHQNLSVPHSPFRSIAAPNIDTNPGPPVPVPEIEIGLSPNDSTMRLIGGVTPALSTKSSSSGSRVLEIDLERTDSLLDLKTEKPILVQPIDSFVGIAKGDITLSLLNEMAPTLTWASRVHAAIWRCRRMRVSMGVFPTDHDYNDAGSTVERLVLPIDQNVASTHDAALSALLNDEIDQALDSYEEILFAYESYYQTSPEATSSFIKKGGDTNFKPYIGIALQNLGILNMLNGDYNAAMTYFTRAIENRKCYLVEGHPDYVASLVKKATCHFALNQHPEAHRQFEEALYWSKKSCSSLEDQVQMSEILNNLGCLAYMCGQPESAKKFFVDSMDVQFDALSESLYYRSPVMSQSISLNISIVRANIGFIKMVTKALPVAITALENALMEQQVLLKGADETIVATMDHLAVANLLKGTPDKAAKMFGRILEIQIKEYGPQDRRCYVTIDKINMVRSRGKDFEEAVKGLQKTFSVPQASPQSSPPKSLSNLDPQPLPTGKQNSKASSKNKVLQVLSSMKRRKSKNNLNTSF